MFAGKSSELMLRAGRMNAVVFKPIFDDRYSQTEIVTHDGECMPAHPFRSMRDIAEVGEVERPYCFDEVQFLDEGRYDGDFVADVQLLLKHGIDIVVSGLDMCAKGKPFPVMAQLLAMADEVQKIGACCTICGSFATKSFRLDDGDTIQLGASDLYEARCNRHWG
jgi:thymidine kinase